MVTGGEVLIDKDGHCHPSSSPYIVGLERSKSNQGQNDYIYHLEAAKCCQGTIPFINDEKDCVIADWVGSFDR
jgi:hypothetical protein